VREIRGATISQFEAEAAEQTDALPVDVARDMLRAAIVDRQITSALAFHKNGNESAPVPEAVCVPTGVGKSAQARNAIARYVGEAKTTYAAKKEGKKKRKRIPHRVLVLVPTHRLGEEARQSLPEGVTTALWQSRKAIDLNTGEPLCLNPQAVAAAEAIGSNVDTTACRKGRKGQPPILCPLYDKCGYQRQKLAAKKADVVFCAHEYLFAASELLTRKVGVVFIDESFWQSGLSHAYVAVDALDAEFAAFPVLDKHGEKNGDDTARLADLTERFKLAIDLSRGAEGGSYAREDGYVTKAALLAAGLLPGDAYEEGSGAAAAKLEWRRKPKVDLDPQTGEEQAKAIAKEFRFLGQLSKRAAMWHAVDGLLSGTDDATGRLRVVMKNTKDGAVLCVRINGRREIHQRIAKLPVVVLDATLNVEILKYYFAEIDVALDLKVLAPYERVTQVVGLPVGKSSLSKREPGSRSVAEEKRVANKRERLIKVIRKLTGGRRTLLITNKELEAQFEGTVPNLETAHFNAIEGIDRWRDVDCLITIGRPLPAPEAIEHMAAALTGKPVSLRAVPPKRAGGRPQVMIERQETVRLKDGTEAVLTARVFEQTEAELVRKAVTEAAIVQAVGRARGVNRSADNPVEIWMVLSDAVVPLALDAVVQFGDLEPNKIDLMIERGLVPAFSADAAKLYPGLWPTAQAARKAYSRDRFDVAGNRRRSVTNPYEYIYIRESHTPLIRYQPKGPGQKSRVAMIDAAGVAGARERIEAAVGELAAFEVITTG
jgi:putative DNA primase/helicase